MKPWYQNGESLKTKAAATISGWDCPLLTFNNPGFDCGSTKVTRVLPVSGAKTVKIVLRKLNGIAPGIFSEFGNSNLKSNMKLHLTKSTYNSIQTGLERVDPI